MNLEQESYYRAFGIPRLEEAEYQAAIELTTAKVAASWKALNARCKQPTLPQRLRLVFTGWQDTLAPKGLPCAVTSMSGFPLYKYKELNGAVFYLRAKEGIGFPGS